MCGYTCVWLLVVVIPVLAHVCTNLSWRLSSDDSSANDEIYHSSTQPILFPSSEPWTSFLNRFHSALGAVMVDNAKAPVTQSRSAVKPAIDTCFFCTTLHKAKLWTVRLESESDKSCTQNDLTSTSLQNFESEVKLPLYLLATKARDDRELHLSHVKLRLAEVLGKHRQKPHVIGSPASLCLLVNGWSALCLTLQSIYRAVVMWLYVRITERSCQLRLHSRLSYIFLLSSSSSYLSSQVIDSHCCLFCHIIPSMQICL